MMACLRTGVAGEGDHSRNCRDRGWPGDLAFESRLTIYANLGWPEGRLAVGWTRVSLSNVGPKYRTPRILDDRGRLRG